MKFKKRQSIYTMKDFNTYKYVIEKAIERLGLNSSKCVVGDCKWQLKKGNLKVNLSFFETHGREYFKVQAPICKVPTLNVTNFYKNLLQYNHEFNGFAFLIYNDKVYLKAVRELQGMDDNEAFSMITKVGNYAERFTF